MTILAMVGVQTFDSLPQALAAPAILLALVIISAEVITPFVLGRGLQLNPVAIFIAIFVVGLAMGPNRSSVGCAALSELQNHLRTCRAFAPNR